MFICHLHVLFSLLADVVVVVKAESVHVYCNPINYPLLLPYIAHWRNLHIHCLNKEEVIDNSFSSSQAWAQLSKGWIVLSTG